MESLEVNKAIAAVLVGGIAFMVAGLIGDVVVSPQRLEHPAIKIDVAEAPAAGAPKPEENVPPIAPLLAKADPAAGEALTKKLCVACHTFNEGGHPGVGPNLYGVVMGPHAHEKGFNYSKAMESKKGVWDYEALNHWLLKPSAYVPGTKMGFAGLKNEQQRADIIDYLRTLSPNPAPLPKP